MRDGQNHESKPLRDGQRAGADGLPPHTRIDPPHPSGLASSGGAADTRESVAAASEARSASAEQSGRAKRAGETNSAAATTATAATTSASATAAQVRNQARQLATHLRNKQRELDRRESQLHAQTAKLDDDLRASRLWVRERVQYFAELEQKLFEQRAAIEQQAAAIAAAEVAADSDFQRRDRELQRRERELRRLEQDLRKERQRLETRTAALETAEARGRAELEQAWQVVTLAEQQAARQRVEFDELQDRLLRNHNRRRDALEAMYRELQQRQAEHDPADLRRELQRALDQLQDRSRQLDRQQATLDSHAAELAAEKQRLVETRAAEQNRWKAAQQAAEQQQARAVRELDEQRRRLRDEADSIEQSRTVVERMRADVAAMHREAIESRLAAEQLQAHLATAGSPAEITKQLAERRNRLADAFALERRVVSEQQAELRALAAELLEQQSSLNGEREQLNQWLRRQENDLEQQAARLIAREHELNRQQQTFAEREQVWANQRSELQHQIRELMSQLRDANKAA